jgi:hypothetical protein
MGLLASRHVAEHFTFERQLRETIDLYRCLVQRHLATTLQAGAQR